MKSMKFFHIIFTVVMTFTLPVVAVEIRETKLKVRTGKLMFIVTKVMLGDESHMKGLADRVEGEVDMQAKKLDITVDMKQENFAISGAYKFANDRMHETYLETAKYDGKARYIGKIVSYDPVTGEARTEGDLTLHGVTRKNFVINGTVIGAPDGEGYEVRATFKIDLRHFNIPVPDIKLATVLPEIELKARFHLR